MKLKEIKQGGVYKVEAMVRKDESSIKDFIKNLFTMSLYTFYLTAETGGVQTFVLKKNHTCEVYKGDLGGNHTLVDSFEINADDFKEMVFKKRKLQRNGYKYKFLKTSFEELDS